MIDFQTIFEHVNEILPSMNFQRHGAQWWSPRNADGSVPRHSRNDKTIVKTIGGIVVAAENGGWGCHRLTEFLKLHLDETQLREIFAKFSSPQPQEISRQNIDYDAHATAAEFLTNCHKHLGEDDGFCNYLNFRGLPIEKIYEKTNIGGYSAKNSTAREQLQKLCQTPNELNRLNSCKSIVLPLFSRGILTGLAFRYIVENRTPKCEKIRLSERYGGLCFQHATPRPDITAVCLVEGEFDAISANLIGLNSIHFVATCGHANAENAIKELRLIYPDADIFAAFDNDETGTRYVTEFQQVDNTIADIRTAFAPSKDINEFLANGGNFQRITDEISAKTTTPFSKTPTFSEIFAQPEEKGIHTGFSVIHEKKADEITLFSGITIFAAPTGHGKSTFLQNIALRLAEQHYQILYITLEESRERVLRHMFSAFSRGDGTKDVSKFDQILLEFLTVSNYENSVECLIADFEKTHRKTPFAAIFIDYLQLLDTDTKTGTRELAVKEIMRGLRTFADKFKIPVVAAAQFNRTASQDFEKMTLHNIGEGGDIERASSVVYSLFQLSKLNEIDILREIVNRHSEQIYRRLGLTGGFSQKDLAKFDVATIAKTHGAIFIRCLKNRFGETDGESVVFSDFSARYCFPHSQTESEPVRIFPADKEFFGTSAYECDIY